MADLVQVLYVKCLTVEEYTITPVQWLQGLFRLVLWMEHRGVQLFALNTYRPSLFSHRVLVKADRNMKMGLHCLLSRMKKVQRMAELFNLSHS